MRNYVKISGVLHTTNLNKQEEKAVYLQETI